MLRLKMCKLAILNRCVARAILNFGAVLFLFGSDDFVLPIQLDHEQEALKQQHLTELFKMQMPYNWIISFSLDL